MTESELMDLIFERPGLYIGHPSVIKMEAFINGFGVGKSHRDPIYAGFTQWVLDRRETRGQYPWSAIATMIGGSEAAAFDVAKEFWAEYKQTLKTESQGSN